MKKVVDLEGQEGDESRCCERCFAYWVEKNPLRFLTIFFGIVFLFSVLFTETYKA